MCCVHVPLPIVTRLSVSKDLHLEVPHHGVHHLPATHTSGRSHTDHPVHWSLVLTRPQVCFLPVDPSRPFLRLDIDVIVIDINLGNLHLEVVGKEPDGFPHRAEAGTPWRLKQRGGSRRAWGGEQSRQSHRASTVKLSTH